MIEVKDLVKKYGTHTAIDHLSFQIEKGKIYGFLGPNGAGKTTTMNIITGYIASTEGTVTINGHDILEEPEQAKKHIGYLPEIPPLYPDMKVLEYLRFAADLKKIPKRQEQQMLEDIMVQTGIQDVKNRLIRNLSKGYRQRIGLAQALIGYPDVIILDEPTVGLDPKQIIEIRSLIRSLKEKHTVILSSHILSEVSAVCDYVMIISHGKMTASGTPEQLSAMAEGKVERNLLIRGQYECIMEGISGIPDIQKSEIRKSTEKDCWEVTITEKENKDSREEIFYAMADRYCPILEMSTKKISLEDIFLELTEDDEKSAGHIPENDQTSGSTDDTAASEIHDNIDSPPASETRDDIDNPAASGRRNDAVGRIASGNFTNSGDPSDPDDHKDIDLLQM